MENINTEMQSALSLLRDEIQAISDVNVLDDVAHQIEKMISKRREELAKEAQHLVISHIKEIAGKHGLSIEAILERIKQQADTSAGSGRGTATRRAGKVPPKYRNPNNPEETWSGRGVKPRWFRDALAAGISPEEMEIHRDHSAHAGGTQEPASAHNEADTPDTTPDNKEEQFINF